MRFWFNKKKTSAEFRTVSLPGEIGTVSIPADFTAEMEDDSTLLAYPKSDDISLRFSSISFVPKKDGQFGKSMVGEFAAERGHSYVEMGDKGVAAFEAFSEQHGVPLVEKCWKVGTKNTIIYVSATIIRNRAASRIVTETLVAIPKILESIEVVTTRRIVRSEGEEIVATETIVEPVPQTITPFGSEETNWLDICEDQARGLSLKYGSAGELEPRELDRIFSRWLFEAEPKDSDEVIANALGAALGNYIVEHHGFRWVVVTDKFGIEYAVRHETGETMAFPRASVWKRIESRTTHFFVGLYLATIDQLKRSAAES